MSEQTSPTLPPWQTTGDERRGYVRRMFADIAGVYDLQNTLMSAGAHHRWRREAVRLLGVGPGQAGLDLCCGTGDFAFELLRVGAGPIVGVDFCGPMLELAAAKPGGRAVKWALADAMNIPLQAGSVDAITVGWGLRNVPDIPTVLREMHRVLRPAGRFAVLDMAKPRGPLSWAASAYCRQVVPLLGTILGKREAYSYLPNSVDTYPEREEIAALACDAGFRQVEVHDLTMGVLCIHLGVK